METITYWDYDEKAKMPVQKTLTVKKPKAIKDYKISLADGERLTLGFTSIKEAKSYAAALADMRKTEVVKVAC